MVWHSDCCKMSATLSATATLQDTFCCAHLLFGLLRLHYVCRARPINSCSKTITQYHSSPVLYLI